MKATSYKRITLFLCIVLLLALAAVGALFGAGSTQASAATYTTPKYKTYGQTTEGTTTTSGSPTNFTIYMHGSSTSGTGYPFCPLDGAEMRLNLIVKGIEKCPKSACF